MKKYKIMFWVTTGIIFLTQGVMESLMINSESARQGIMHLGYPAYFFTMLVVFKALGALVLIIPKVPSRVKEWAYAGFGIDFIAAFISMIAVDGVNGGLMFPIIAMMLLTLSYISYHKMNEVVVVNQ